MDSNIIFVYDGLCPFCNHFAELIELKSNLPNIKVVNARENISYLPKGYDMDTKGAILIRNGEILNGAKAINWICSQITSPSDSLLKIISSTFSSRARSNYLFPFLLIARRLALYLKGVPIKIHKQDF